MKNFTLSVIIWFGKWPDQHLYYLQPHPHIMYYHFHFNHHPLYIHLHICGTKIFVNILRCSQQETSKNEKWHFHCNHHPLCPSSYLAKGRENKHLSTGYIDFSATAAQTYNLHHTIKVWHSPFLILWSKQQGQKLGSCCRNQSELVPIWCESSPGLNDYNLPSLSNCLDVRGWLCNIILPAAGNWVRICRLWLDLPTAASTPHVPGQDRSWYNFPFASRYTRHKDKTIQS